MTEIDSTPEALRRLVALVAENGLRELTVESGGIQITVRAERDVTPIGDAPVVVSPTILPTSPVPVPPIPPLTAPKTRSAGAVALESPMVGVFYRSPSPEDPPFVGVGDTVRVGQPIGLIEAMKVFSEVPAEIAGRVIEMPVESGKLVQMGQPLIYIEPS